MSHQFEATLLEEKKVQVQTVKSQYAAPEARRTRIRPFAPASARRRPVTTWKDSAQAALGAQVETRTAFVIAEVSANVDRIESAPVRNRPTLRVWEVWQVIAPVIIALCAIAQLAQSIR
jgi:hypothetical protein